MKKIRKLLRPLKALYFLVIGYYVLFKHKRHFKSAQERIDHDLPGELIISLTSYPKRYATLRPTLECLLSQEIKPDRVILWVAKEDAEALTPDIKALEEKGLDIRITATDLKVYNKLIPALTEFPDAFIVTADDDIYYPPEWLGELIKYWDKLDSRIVCHRAHIIKMNDDQLPAPYNSWKWGAQAANDTDRIFPTGVGGVLYPPKSLPLPETLDSALFQKLAPGADDLWLYWMARKNKTEYKITDYNKREVIVWPGSQIVSLSADNTGIHTGISANDTKIQNLINHYGFL